MGAVAKSYMGEGFLIYDEMRKYLVINEEAVSHIWLCHRSWISLGKCGIFFFFISVHFRILSEPVIVNTDLPVCIHFLYIFAPAETLKVNV